MLFYRGDHHGGLRLPVTSGIVPVVDFGWMMTVGVALALGVTFVLFPLAVTVLPAGGTGTTPRTPVFVELLGRAAAIPWPWCSEAASSPSPPAASAA